MGAAVGDTVGEAVGIKVGASVGFAEGATVGNAVGCDVGTTVGLAVGDADTAAGVAVVGPAVAAPKSAAVLLHVPWIANPMLLVSR